MGRNCAIPGVGRRLRQAQDKVKGARGWQNLAQILYELCHNISQSSNLPIRAWHFKAGAVNLFSGLRAPAAPSLTVDTAFVSPVGWYLFPGGPVCSPAPCRGLVGPDFPGLVPALVVLGPVVVWPDAGVSSGARRRVAGAPRRAGLGFAGDGWTPLSCEGHPRVYGVGVRVIPAPVGLGPTYWSWSLTRLGHPRACGACRGNLHRGRVRWRSSPRLRGNRCH